MSTTTPQKRKHKWAAGGVSSYPLTHPIVGQTRFFDQFKHFIHLVDDESEKFAHVFGIVAQWGIGKSRLAYELMSQINETSPGWYVRDASGTLDKASLFHDDDDRDQYLGLYIRYSQVATESHNIDNWFGFGLYKALLPLTRGTFDSSIQGQIAKEAYDRLLVKGFEESKLADALEVSEGHSDETLYDDPELVTRLCQQAYEYLQTFGIKYVLIALDELETAAEAATYGLEVEDMKYLDGRAIKLIGKAIKEEDPRGKLPWLRYVALCSPAIGNELREIKSTARRFEMVELSQNAFADVSSFVELLKDDDRLAESYPDGLVEAAYAMGGGNFGWFNVVMANIDGVISGRRARDSKDPTTVGSLFDEAAKVSSRMSEHVLDHNAIGELELARDHHSAAAELLYGQLPVALDSLAEEARLALQNGTNEYGEPIATLYQPVEWTEQNCGKALRSAKFTREKDEWVLTGVEQPLDLRQLLANLSTWSIHETKGEAQSGAKYRLLTPLSVGEFAQLVSMLYPHPAAEDAARAIWREQVGTDGVSSESATHIGPSIDMLGRLNLRYRKQGATSLIFREPDQSSAHEEAIKACKGQSESDRARQVLTGLMRAVDKNWGYEPVDAGLKVDFVAISTSPSKTRGSSGGLVTCHELHLHPEGKFILAWVRKLEDLEELCNRVTEQFSKWGRVPVLAFTSSRHLVEQFEQAPKQVFKDAQDYLLLYQLSSREEFVLHPVGLERKDCKGFEFSPQRYSTLYVNRLQTLLRPLHERITGWRRELDARGRIAWPMRVSGTLKDDDRDELFGAYCSALLHGDSPKSLLASQEQLGFDLPSLVGTLERMRPTTAARAAGYADNERCSLFSSPEQSGVPQVPAFLHRICERAIDGNEWSYDAAKKEWFWGYVWEGAKPVDTYVQWMALLCELGFVEESSEGKRKNDKRYRLIQRHSMRGLVDEARNWLNDTYPQLVAKMKEVFGEKRVDAGFAALDAQQPGTKTIDARDKLDKTKSALDDLDVAEGSWDKATDPPTRQAKLIECAEKRRLAQRNTHFVYDRGGFTRLQRDDSLKRLDFDDDDKDLWRRIGQASLFVDDAVSAKNRIIARIDSLSTELHEQTDDLTGFPIRVFTRSLEKIVNILNGAIRTADPSGTTQTIQVTEPGTLGHALKELKVAQATEKLQQLADEVGIELESDHESALDDIPGTIIQNFHGLVRDYRKEREELERVVEQITTAEAVLTDAPDDFEYPSTIPSLSDLSGRPELIEQELTEALSEDVESLISEHDKTSSYGNFKPLMDAARGLLTSPKRALGVLRGSVTTLENQISSYRRKLLESEELQSVEDAYNSLLEIQGKPAEPRLTPADIEGAGSLANARQLVRDRCSAWPTEAEKLLDGTEVSFQLWRTIVSDIGEGRKPEMSTEQADKLVSKGFIEVTYKLGGQS